ncbi:hypothetical protein ACM79J_31360 [Pseudomonas aeruginosa]
MADALGIDWPEYKALNKIHEEPIRVETVLPVL